MSRRTTRAWGWLRMRRPTRKVRRRESRAIARASLHEEYRRSGAGSAHFFPFEHTDVRRGDVLKTGHSKHLSLCGARDHRLLERRRRERRVSSVPVKQPPLAFFQTLESVSRDDERSLHRVGSSPSLEQVRLLQKNRFARDAAESFRERRAALFYSF